MPHHFSATSVAATPTRATVTPMTRRRTAKNLQKTHQHFAADASKGLEPAVANELRSFGATNVQVGTELVTFSHSNIARLLPALRLANTVYAVHTFAVPRPRALLGDQHFRQLSALVRFARGSFQGLRIEAAGKDSAVMNRIGTELAQVAGVPFAPEDGDLVVRIVRANGWRVLVRITPRPLSARSWRVCNIPGGLHAPLAVFMNALSGATPQSRYVNLFAGSGTLAIEHALAGGTATAVEIDPATVACLTQNAAAAGVTNRVHPITADALAPHPQLAPGTADVVTADPPWGDAVGKHVQSEALHHALFTRAAELLAKDGTFVLVTHELRITRRLLAAHNYGLQVAKEHQVAHGGHHPLVLVLRRGKARANMTP